MIDDKKIKSAAQRYCDATYGITDDGPFITEAFRKGAQWAINEFLKDLWHPANEEPHKKATLLIESSPTKLTPKKLYYADILIGEDWEIKCSVMYISRWLYVDDLLSKKGGGQ